MQEKSLWTKAGRLFFLLVLTNCIGYLGSAYMTPSTLKWYHTLPMSALTPPDFVFALVWSVLFFLMSVSAFFVWGKASPRWFVLQLMMNMAWSFSFFYLKLPGVALMIILAMIFCVIQCVREFYKVSKISGLLFIPLLLWSLFAIYLNAYIVFN